MDGQCRSIPGGRHLDASYQTMFGDVAELRLQQAACARHSSRPLQQIMQYSRKLTDISDIDSVMGNVHFATTPLRLLPSLVICAVNFGTRAIAVNVTTRS
jgi:hypothetical protein